MMNESPSKSDSQPIGARLPQSTKSNEEIVKDLLLDLKQPRKSGFSDIQKSGAMKSYYKRAEEGPQENLAHSAVSGESVAYQERQALEIEQVSHKDQNQMDEGKDKKMSWKRIVFVIALTIMTIVGISVGLGVKKKKIPEALTSENPLSRDIEYQIFYVDVDNSSSLSTESLQSLFALSLELSLSDVIVSRDPEAEIEGFEFTVSIEKSSLNVENSFAIIQESSYQFMYLRGVRRIYDTNSQETMTFCSGGIVSTNCSSCPSGSYLYNDTCRSDPVVTTAPSTSPSYVPSAAPVNSPSMIPSIAPSILPTVTPSKSPSSAPTTAPTNSPSAAPSRAPTVAPTKSPTTAPTNAPSAAPTRAPTVSPTNAPSAAPTRAPTVAPTKSPTTAPESNLQISASLVIATFTPSMMSGYFELSASQNSSTAWQMKVYFQESMQIQFLNVSTATGESFNQEGSFGALRLLSPNGAREFSTGVTERIFFEASHSPTVTIEHVQSEFISSHDIVFGL